VEIKKEGNRSGGRGAGTDRLKARLRTRKVGRKEAQKLRGLRRGPLRAYRRDGRVAGGEEILVLFVARHSESPAWLRCGRMPQPRPNLRALSSQLSALNSQLPTPTFRPKLSAPIRFAAKRRKKCRGLRRGSLRAYWRDGGVDEGEDNFCALCGHHSESPARLCCGRMPQPRPSLRTLSSQTNAP